MNQKGFAPILILLGIVLLAAVAGGAFYIGKIVGTPPEILPVVTPTPKLLPTSVITPTATIDEIASWKIYINSVFDFEFKYPSNFVVTDKLPTKKVDYTGVSENLLLTDKTNGIELSIWIDTDGFGPIFSDKTLIIDYSAEKGIFVVKEINEDVTKYRNDNQTIIMTAATQINNRGVLMTYTYPKGDVVKEKVFTKILATFKFSENLIQADSQTPASGVCGGSESATAAVVTLNEDMPAPRCIIVKANQQLEVVNNTNQTVTFTLGQNSLSINPNQKKTITQTFGSYLAPGIHNTKTSLYGGSGPEIWLQ